MHEEVMWLDYVPGLNSLPHFVSYAILASAIIIGVAFIVSRSMSLVPGRVQNFVEILFLALWPYRYYGFARLLENLPFQHP